MLVRQDAHQTEFKMSCVAVQQTAANPRGRAAGGLDGWGRGGIISDHLSRVWLVHRGKCLSCSPVCPPARQSPSPLVVAREVENVWTNKSSVIGSLTDCRRPFSGTRYKSDITAVQKTGIFSFFFFLPTWTPVEQNHGCASSQNIFFALIHV